MNVAVIDDAYRTAVGYVCLWEVKLSGSKFLQISNHAIIWWVGQVKYRYQNMTTLYQKLSDKTTENIMLQFKVFNEQKTVPFKRYVFIQRGNTYYMTGTCQWRMHSLSG